MAGVPFHARPIETELIPLHQLTDAQCFTPGCNRTFWATTEELRRMTRQNRNRTYCAEHRPRA